MTKPRSARSKRERVQLETGPESRTKQEFRDESDINVLMGRYLKTGQITNLNPRQAVFMDVSELGDYRTVVERGRELTGLFEALPSDVRDEFGNDPLEFFEYAATADQDELLELGLIAPESETDPQDPAGDEPAPPLEEEEEEPSDEG